MAEIPIVAQDFESFRVYSLEDSYSFFHIHISDQKKFYKGICEYLLNEENLLKYAENKVSLKFEPIRKNYVTLYKQLFYFIDQENITTIQIEKELEDILNVLLDEFEVVTNNGTKTEIRLSKIGRLGEYIFHIFLSQYFSFDCIIPKVRLTTDINMSVHGIDELFIDRSKKTILFGESKVTKNIDNGITMINKSLNNVT